MSGVLLSSSSDKHVAMAINHIITTFPTVDAYDNAFLKYAFDTPGTSLDLGYYSMANGPSPMFKVSGVHDGVMHIGHP